MLLRVFDVISSRYLGQNRLKIYFIKVAFYTWGKLNKNI